MPPTDLDRAREMRSEAKAAVNSGDHARASKLYFEAAKLYASAGKPYWQKYYENWGWSEKAMAMGLTDSAEADMEKAGYYDRAIQAINSALQYPEADYVDEGNVRFDEGNKYTCLANAEVEYANATSGEQKILHLHQAAEYRLSGATASKQAANASLKGGDEGTYLSRMGSYYSDVSGQYFYRAWAADEQGNWPEALTEYERAKAERERAVEQYRKALSIKQSGVRERNLERADNWVVKLDKYIAKVRPKAEWIMREKANLPKVATVSPPKLDVAVEATEGMLENLVSTISVALGNSGEGEARNIGVELASQFLTGDTTASLSRLKAGAKNRVGLSVLPTHAGTPTATLIISYEDAQGESFTQRTDTSLNVARRGEDRPEGGATIVNVQGDYATGTMLKDSVANRSNFGESEGGGLDSLRELIQWRQDGLISDDEFKAAKSKLLG